jgi:hypothetical protein
MLALPNNPSPCKTGLSVTGESFLHYPPRNLPNIRLNRHFGNHLGLLAHGPKDGLRVVVDKKLVTGQNQWPESEYALQLYHLLTGSTPVAFA